MVTNSFVICMLGQRIGHRLSKTDKKTKDRIELKGTTNMVPNSNSNTFQALSDTEVFVLESNYNLWLEHGPSHGPPTRRQQVDKNVQAFQALSDTEVLVLGTDYNLWLEHGPFGQIPPPRQQVDKNVLAFQALSGTEVLVLDSDGKLWLEHRPFGQVPPPRQQVDGNVSLTPLPTQSELP